MKRAAAALTMKTHIHMRVPPTDTGSLVNRPNKQRAYRRAHTVIKTTDRTRMDVVIHCQRTGIVLVGVETRPGVPRFSTPDVLDAENVPTRGDKAKGPLKKPGNWKAELEFSRGLRVVTGLKELQKWTGCMGLGKKRGVVMPWKADIGCLAEGEMMDMCVLTGVRGELPRALVPRVGTPRVIGLGFGLLMEDVVDAAEDVAVVVLVVT